MLVLEGADNLGKTAAAKKLVDRMNLRIDDHKPAHPELWHVDYAHMGRPGPDWDWGMDYRPMVNSMRVQDRFHLGSVVWHENVMTRARLSVIEGWIKAAGGLVVIFVATDEDWYRHHLQTSGKKELFSVEALVEANRKFLTIGGSRSEMMVDVGENRFLDEAGMDQILDEWWDRLSFVGAL